MYSRKKPTEKTWGYVYILKSLDRYKIGYTSDQGTLRKRVNRLHLQNAYGATLQFVIQSRRAFSVEGTLHRKFAHKRVHGEWFELGKSDLNWIENRYRREIYYADELGMNP